MEQEIGFARAPRNIMDVASQPEKRPLLAPGNEAAWARLNAEKRQALIPPPDTPIGELLRRGQRLSAQGAKLLRAVERADGHRRS